MKRLGFIYNIDKCIGCKACQVACKDKNNSEIGTFFRRVEIVNDNGRERAFSGGCNHCENPACVKNCPTGAMYISDEKTVLHNSGKCIGCSMCVWSCPYKAVKLSEQKGIATKCGSCGDLRKSGQKPACVQACVTHCLDFDYIEDYEIKESPSFLPSNDITNPSLVIIENEDMEEK